jgi:hypothetical protein
MSRAQIRGRPVRRMVVRRRRLRKMEVQQRPGPAESRVQRFRHQIVGIRMIDIRQADIPVVPIPVGRSQEQAGEAFRRNRRGRSVWSHEGKAKTKKEAHLTGCASLSLWCCCVEIMRRWNTRIAEGAKPAARHPRRQRPARPSPFPSLRDASGGLQRASGAFRPAPARYPEAR